MTQPAQCLVADLDPRCDPDSDPDVEPAAVVTAPELDATATVTPLFGAGAQAIVTDLDPQIVVTEIEG